MINQTKILKLKDFVPAKGRLYATGKRKTAIVKVFASLITTPINQTESNTSTFIVNGISGNEYFGQVLELANNALFPLKATGHYGKYKIYCQVSGGGKQAQSDAISLGIAKILLEQDVSLLTVLKSHNLLTRDSREVERKKPGLRKARKAEQFSKR